MNDSNDSLERIATEMRCAIAMAEHNTPRMLSEWADRLEAISKRLLIHLNAIVETEEANSAMLEDLSKRLMQL